jgi:two-component system phosphate regulon sensor histidine kinase PhoR
MRRNSIGFLVIIATISVLGILFIQFFFLKNSFDLNEKQFHQLTTSALRSVASQINEYNSKLYHHQAKATDLCQVEQISNNYYVVNVNDVIDSGILEHLLTVEFQKRNLNLTFEFGIYDCNSKRMIHGNVLKKDSMNIPKQVRARDTIRCSLEEILFDKQYQPQNQTRERSGKICNLPTCEKFTYYFGVHFPDRSEYYNSRLFVWYFMNGILFFIVIFFGYALYVIIKQKKLSEIQKNFINNLTHEFKTPIASIDLAAKILANPKICETPERLQEYVRIVDKQNMRLSAHVERLLQMATIEKSKINLNLEVIDLKDYLEILVQEFRNSQNGRNYAVEFNFMSGPITIMADKLYFSNLVFNILDNAIKYCTTDPVIKIFAEEKNNFYELSFADNGIGIPKEFRKKIFTRFYRVPTGNVHDVKGFGLGLDYVQKIVRRHGWQIEVNDNSGKGTTFTLKIKKFNS